MRSAEERLNKFHCQAKGKVVSLLGGLLEQSGCSPACIRGVIHASFRFVFPTKVVVTTK